MISPESGKIVRYREEIEKKTERDRKYTGNDDRWTTDMVN